MLLHTSKRTFLEECDYIQRTLREGYKGLCYHTHLKEHSMRNVTISKEHWVRDKGVYVTHHHHQSLNREGRWGTTDNFATSFLHFPLFSTALWDLPNSRPIHSLMLSSHLFLCPPCLLPPFTVPCKMVLARPDERET